MITPAQCRAARALLDLSQQALADRASVGVVTIRQFEGGASEPRRATRDVIQRAFEAAGIEFIAENGGGAGLRLKRRASTPDHPKPSGPATDVVDSMENAISKDRARLASVKETGEEVPQEEWERFERADKKPQR